MTDSASTLSTLTAELEDARAEIARLKQALGEDPSVAPVGAEHRDAEGELRRSELALKASQRVAHLGSWAWHVQSNRLDWSDEMFRIFGIDPVGFAGDLNAVIESAIHPDDRAAVERVNRSVAEEGKPIPLEYRVVRPDGTVRVVWAEAGELLRDAEGRPEILTGIVQDITKRKEVEDALRASEERHRRLVEAIPGILYTFSDKLGGSYYSPQVQAILGYSAEHLLNTTGVSAAVGST